MAKTNRSPSGRGKSLPSAHQRAQAATESNRRASARESHDEKKAAAERAAERATRADDAEHPILHLPTERQTKPRDEALSRWEGEGGHTAPKPGPASRSAAPDSRRATDSRTEKRATSTRDGGDGNAEESARETRPSDRSSTTGPQRSNVRRRDARFPDDKTSDDDVPRRDHDER